MEISELELKAKIDEAVNGLRSKNDELLGELKAARKGQQIDPAKYDALEADRDALKQQLREAEKVTKQLQSTEKLLAEEQTARKRLLIDTKLTEGLTGLNVSASMMRAAKAMILSESSLSDDGAVKVGDKKLADYLTEWSATDEGKSFIKAPINTGGGAVGNTGSGATGKTATVAEFMQMSQNDRSAFSTAGGKLTD
jgi:hypothetical protein